MRFAGIFRPAEFRTVTRAHLIAGAGSAARRSGIGWPRWPAVRISL
jgi:hypothetical protein